MLTIPVLVYMLDVAIFLTRRYLVPAIPDPVFRDESVHISKATVLMLRLAVTMLVAAVTMIADRKIRMLTKLRRFGTRPR